MTAREKETERAKNRQKLFELKKFLLQSQSKNFVSIFEGDFTDSQAKSIGRSLN